MHTGTLIQDLVAAVEWAEWNLRHPRSFDDFQPPILLDLRVPAVEAKSVLAGAA